jgi:hypothetical protein
LLVALNLVTFRDPILGLSEVVKVLFAKH